MYNINVNVHCTIKPFWFLFQDKIKYNGCLKYVPNYLHPPLPVKLGFCSPSVFSRVAISPFITDHPVFIPDCPVFK